METFLDITQELGSIYRAVDKKSHQKKSIWHAKIRATKEICGSTGRKRPAARKKRKKRKSR
jgi:hypothetical protein